MIAALLLASLLDIPWKAVPASGVQMKLMQTDHLHVDFDFQGHGGYAISRRDGKIELPENFELSFRIKGDAPRETLEVKFVQGDNVWWTTRREFEFPKNWRRMSIKKRQFEFAWGPIGPSPLPTTIDAIEIVITAGTGGKGTVWIDDVELAPLETAPGPPPSNAFPANADLGARYEIGGVVMEGSAREVATSIDGKQWDVQFISDAQWIPMPDTDARFIRADGAKSIRVLPPMKSDNDFFMAMAKEFRRGVFPRYLYGEQSYWTILGGTNGEEEEALFSEDGAIEAGHARFSIEPFLLIDGKVVTWNDVAVEQREGPQVVWKKYLTITPRYENGALKVRYETAPNAKLLLAVRPFQVNTPWQFLNRTGGVVKIRSIARDGDRITADADRQLTFTAHAEAFGNAGLDLPERSVAGDFKGAALAFNDHDVTIEIPLGEPVSTQHPALSTFSLDLPAEPRIAKTIAAQLNDILINKDGAAIHPGSRSYERSWIRDGSLTSEALLRLGRADVVREYIEWYAKAIREDGYVPCCVSAAGADPVPEHDSHGQFIYLVAEYYRHTGDRALVERMLPTVRRIVAFIDKLRHERMTPQYQGTPFYGLVPESISHEGYSAKPMHSYWDDLFVYKGLKDAEFLTEEKNFADEFRRDLLKSLRLSMQQHHIDYIPGSAELGDFDATSTTVAVTPVGADLPRGPLVRTFEKYWEHALEPRDYTPYELRIVGTLIRLGQAERARTLLAYFFDDQRPAAWHQWAEVVRANPRQGGFIGDMPHTWVGSDFIRSALDLLAYEEGEALIIGAGLAPEWVRRGVTVRGLSTHYGLLDYSIDAERIRIGGTLRVPPKGIVVRSPSGRQYAADKVPAEIHFKDGS